MGNLRALSEEIKKSGKLNPMDIREIRRKSRGNPKTVQGKFKFSVYLPFALLKMSSKIVKMAIRWKFFRK